MTSCTLSISDFEIANFKIFPNPTKDSFQIETTLEIETMVVLDLKGKKIKTYPTNQENYFASDLSSGLYFLKIQLRSGESFMKKLIVN